MTSNLRHFPTAQLEVFGVAAVDPDTFALLCIDANPVVAATLVEDHPKPEEFLLRLAASLPRTAQVLEGLVS